MALPVERRGDSTEAMPLRAKLRDRGNRSLLGGVRLHVLPVGRKAETVRDISRPFALSPLVAQRIPRSLADRFAFPLADRAHNRDDEAPSR